MRRLLLPLASVALALLAGCGGAAEPGAVSQAPLTAPELVEALQAGGHVVFLRHTATDHSQEDTNKTDVSACAGMRNLTAAGREQARTIGRAFRSLRISVGAVLASEYCRTRETAELAFGRYEREPRLTGFPPEQPPGPYAARIRETKELLGARPAAGQNTVLVAHVRNLEATLELTIEEGDLAVFEPLGGGRSRYLGRIPASAWPKLVEHVATRAS